MKAEKMKLGLVGLGQRGSALLNDIFIPSERVEVAAVCDIYQDRIDAVVQKVTKAGQKAPFTTQNYKELIDKDKVDLVVVASPWKEHVPMPWKKASRAAVRLAVRRALTNAFRWSIPGKRRARRICFWKTAVTADAK